MSERIHQYDEDGTPEEIHRPLETSGDETVDSRLRATRCLSDLRESVMEHFPAYWPAVEAGLGAFPPDDYQPGVHLNPKPTIPSVRPRA